MASTKRADLSLAGKHQKAWGRWVFFICLTQYFKLSFAKFQNQGNLRELIDLIEYLIELIYFFILAGLIALAFVMAIREWGVIRTR